MKKIKKDMWKHYGCCNGCKHEISDCIDAINEMKRYVETNAEAIIELQDRLERLEKKTHYLDEVCEECGFHQPKFGKDHSMYCSKSKEASLSTACDHDLDYSCIHCDPYFEGKKVCPHNELESLPNPNNEDSLMFRCKKCGQFV